MRSRQWLLCVLAFLASQSLAAERPWRLVIGPHYRVLSQLNDRETAGWMHRFDQYIVATSAFLKLDLQALPPLTVVIFDRDKDFEPYKMTRPNGLTATNVAGFFVRRPTWSMIGMAEEGDSNELRHTLQHEATHWLMSVDQARQPAWFTEGIAEMFATFERRADKVNWAKPIDAHLNLLRNISPEPLEQLLVERSALFNRDDRTQRFYAESWAFTHFLFFADNAAHRPQLIQFLHTYKTRSGEATVAEVFGSQLSALEKEFHLYIDQSRYYYMIEPAQAVADPPPAQPAPAALVEASLGFLALGSERYELAEQHARKVIALDASSPEGHRILAYLALEKQNMAEATRQAEAAIDAGTKDSALYMLLGDSYATGDNAQAEDAPRARANQYENAINLNPVQLNYYERLTEALFAIDKPREEDGKFLQVGLRAFPGDDWIRVGSAVVDYRLGHHDTAMATIDSVLRSESTLEPTQRSYAANLRTNWLMDAMRSELQEATDKDDYAGARAVIARYRERIGQDADVASYLDDVTRNVEIGDLVSKYRAALRDNNKTQANRLSQQLLARPDLPGNLREFLQKQPRTVSGTARPNGR
jgi:tetratricopeptide (TPR) repeat protein